MPEDPQVTPGAEVPVPKPPTTAQRVERLERKVNEMHGLVREIHAMSKEAWELMNTPAVRAMRAIKRGPVLGGRRG